MAAWANRPSGARVGRISVGDDHFAQVHQGAIDFGRGHRLRVRCRDDGHEGAARNQQHAQSDGQLTEGEAGGVHGVRFRQAIGRLVRDAVGRELLPLPDELPQDEPEQAVVDQLTACLPRVLTELDCADRDILTRCDIEGMTQQAYANQQGLDAEYMLMRAKMNYGLEVSDEPVLDE